MPDNDALHAYKPLLPAVKTGQALDSRCKDKVFFNTPKIAQIKILIWIEDYDGGDFLNFFDTENKKIRITNAEKYK